MLLNRVIVNLAIPNKNINIIKVPKKIIKIELSVIFYIFLAFPMILVFPYICYRPIFYFVAN